MRSHYSPVWESIYGDLDSYAVWSQIKDGDPFSITYNGSTFTFRFEGEVVGKNNRLRVTKQPSGTSRIYTPGFDLEPIFIAIEELVADWSNPQHPSYPVFNHD